MLYPLLASCKILGILNAVFGYAHVRLDISVNMASMRRSAKGMHRTISSSVFEGKVTTYLHFPFSLKVSAEQDSPHSGHIPSKASTGSRGGLGYIALPDSEAVYPSSADVSVLSGASIDFWKSGMSMVLGRVEGRSDCVPSALVKGVVNPVSWASSGVVGG
jgi:hypothetical protein